jgi:hypothetical protein
LASKFEEVLLRAQKIFQIQSRVLKNAEFYADSKFVETGSQNVFKVMGKKMCEF